MCARILGGGFWVAARTTRSTISARTLFSRFFRTISAALMLVDGVNSIVGLACRCRI